MRTADNSWEPPRAQRHHVPSTLVTDGGADRARATSDVIFTVVSETGRAVVLVGPCEDILHCHNGGWRFHRRAAAFVPPEYRREAR